MARRFSCFPSVSKRTKSMPIETAFSLPSPLPTWPPGDGFAKGVMNMGGLEVAQVSTFDKVWSAQEGGQDNLGATFFTPSPVPAGFFILGCYGQPNSKPLSGWVLVGRDVDGDSITGALKRPIDYTLAWTSESLGIKQDGHGYFWLPVAPQGYSPVGLLATATPDKPSPDAIRCVRADLTDECESDAWIWGGNGVDLYSLRPKTRTIDSPGVLVGTFQLGTTTSSLRCLKNRDFSLSAMPTFEQIDALAKAYAPVISFHPDESYLPSSVPWFFSNGALLYKRDDPTRPSAIDPTGANLPLFGSNDGAYWLDLPAGDDAVRNKVMRGDLQSSVVYIHVKPMLGATFTDMAVWVFCPFNGPARARVGPLVKTLSLGRIGEHVGDWEHVTLRVSNLTGELWRVYFSQHSAGEWVDSSGVEFQQGTNRALAYSALHSHAFYPHPGLVLQGNSKVGVGIRNDTASGGARLDVAGARRWEVVAAEYLKGEVVEPKWVNYFREWGPKVTYSVADELRKAMRWVPGKLRQEVEKVVNGLPPEVLGEEGPTGPKEKIYWRGDEV